MGISERKEREKEELRKKIMDAARQLFVELGIEQTSMRKIADAIEYSPTAIYLHFADKETLLREICNQDFAALHQAEAIAASIADPIERIRGIGKGYMEFGAAHPQHYRLMFMTSHKVPLTEDDLKRKGDPTHDGYAVLQHAVREAMAQGRFRDEFRDVDLICTTFWASVHGVVALEISFKNDPWISLPPFEQRAEAALDMSIRGMCREAASR